MADYVTGISLREVRKLLDEKPISEAPLDAVSKFLDAAILLSPLVAGPVVGAMLLVLVEPKNALVELGRDAIRKFSKPQSGDYIAQATRFAAANCLLTYTAYFDAFSQCLPSLMKQIKLSEKDKQQIAQGRTDRQPGVNLHKGKTGRHDLRARFDRERLADQPISVPHPVNDGLEADIRLALYEAMSWRAVQLLDSYDVIWRQLPDGADNGFVTVLVDEIPALAEKLYRDGRVGLAIDFPQFLNWLLLTDHDTQDALIRKIGADVRTQFELTGRTMHLGFRDIAERMDGITRALAALGAPAAGQPTDDALAAVAADLHTWYLSRTQRPVIEDSYKPAADGHKLSYPTIDESYVPQAYRLASYDDPSLHLEQEDTWATQPVSDDLVSFLVRYVGSNYSIQQPLLILGHPGAGKSLLTRLLAARLPDLGYTAVRVELRDADPKMSIQQQIETQIYKDISERVTWAKFAKAMPTPPIVILDGYDELLQATKSTHNEYLTSVQQFQESEAALSRPVRIIVTSRITLIDKVSIPDGTTIARLEEFDESHRAEWIRVWNKHNATYFDEAGVDPFTVPDNPGITELAAQPLLLLMLAIYDSAANDLSSRPDIDQTQLYYELLNRFIRRELDKNSQGFRKLSEPDQKTRLTRELDRLAVVAMGMFNRQTLVIHRDELDEDLRYFAVEQRGTAPEPPALSPAELLIGSFFFIHVSRSRLAGALADTAAGPAAFEFLHKTFGEFLTAEYLLSQVLTQTEGVADLAGNPRHEATLQRNMELLDETWFGCLIHTPLYTQPNVLAMLRQRGARRLAQGPHSRPELLAALDRILLVQLRKLLTAIVLPPLATQDRNSPYEPQAALGHLAIYSLNLVLLRAYLSDDPLILREADLGETPDGCRPWDRLTAIWRAWFPAEGLAALASCLTATRQGADIMIEPSGSPLARTTGTPLASAYNIGLALGDNLTAISHGLHLTSLEPTPEDYLNALSRRFADGDDTGLMPVLDMMRWRASPHADGELEIGRYNFDFYADPPGGQLLPSLAIDYMETADRVHLSPGRRLRADGRRESLVAFARMPRYAAEVAVHYNVFSNREWLSLLVGDRRNEEWRELLTGPAGAPVLRALLRQWGAGDYHYLAHQTEIAFPDGMDAVFDADTAASLAIIAWRAELMELCSQVLELLVRACGQGTWRLLDIPAELWSPLAEILVAKESEMKKRRKEIVELIKQESLVNGQLDLDSSVSTLMVEFLICALRIGVPFAGKHLGKLTAITIESRWFGDRPRKWFLLLVRWARENNKRAFIRDVFSRTSRPYASEEPRPRWAYILDLPNDLIRGNPDIDKIALSANLTYREAVDLRWAIEVTR